KQDRCHTITIDTAEGRPLPLCQVEYAQHQQYIENNQPRTTYKTELFSNSTKDKVGILLGHKRVFCRRTIQETLPPQATGTNSYFRLQHIIIRNIATATLLTFFQ